MPEENETSIFIGQPLFTGFVRSPPREGDLEEEKAPESMRKLLDFFSHYVYDYSCGHIEFFSYTVGVLDDKYYFMPPTAIYSKRFGWCFKQ